MDDDDLNVTDVYSQPRNDGNRVQVQSFISRRRKDDTAALTKDSEVEMAASASAPGVLPEVDEDVESVLTIAILIPDSKQLFGTQRRRRQETAVFDGKFDIK